MQPLQCAFVIHFLKFAYPYCPFSLPPFALCFSTSGRSMPAGWGRGRRRGRFGGCTAVKGAVRRATATAAAGSWPQAAAVASRSARTSPPAASQQGLLQGGLIFPTVFSRLEPGRPGWIELRLTGARSQTRHKTGDVTLWQVCRHHGTLITSSRDGYVTREHTADDRHSATQNQASRTRRHGK